MKKYCEVMGAICTRSCKVVVDNKEYTVMAQFSHYRGNTAKADYYLIREDNPDLAIQCGSILANAHFLDSGFVDHWFWAGVQRYGSIMTEKYDKEVMKYRKVG